MFEKKNWSLIAIVFTGVALIILLCFFAYKDNEEFKNTILTKSQEHMLTTVNETAHMIKTFLSEHAKAMQGLSLNQKVQKRIARGPEAQCEPGDNCPIKRFYKSHDKDIDAVCLLNSEGMILERFPFWEDKQDRRGIKCGIHASKASHLIEEKKGIISTLFYNNLGALAVGIYEPIFNEGTFVGMVMAMIEVNTLVQRFIQPSKIGAGGYLFLLGDDGTIYHHPEPKFIGKDITILQNKELDKDERHFIDKICKGSEGTGKFVLDAFSDKPLSFAWSYITPNPKARGTAGIKLRYDQNIPRYSLEKRARLIALELDRAIPKLENLVDTVYLKETIKEIQKKYKNIIEITIHGPRSSEDTTLVYKASTSPGLEGKLSDREDREAIEDDVLNIQFVKQKQGRPHAGEDVIDVTDPIHIDETIWPIVAVMPYSEIIGPVNKHAIRTYSFTGLFMLIFFVAGCVIYNTQKRRAILEAEAENLKKIAQSAEALHESEAQKQSILDASIDVIIYLNADMRIIWANKRAGEIVNKKPEDLIGHTCHSLYRDSDTPCEGCPGSLAITTGAIEHNVMHQQLINGLGESFWENYSVPVKNKNGQIIGVIEMARNITDRKKDEKALQAALDKAQESDRLKSAFLANTSHEIRTPLNPILGYADLMLYDEKQPEHREYLTIIKNSVNLLLSIIDDILDLSKIEAGQLELEQIPVSLVTLFETMHSNSELLLSQQGKRITLIHSISDSISEYIMADPTRLQQIVYNMLNNAVKFTAKGCIEYGVSLKDESTLEFYVRDSGIGIPEEKQEEIFKPFHQADVSHTRKYGGTGLGLTICKKLVGAMGGTIRIKSDVGAHHGSTFSFTIPYKPTTVKKENNTRKRTMIEAKAGYTILIAEDDIPNQRLIKRILEKSGFTVATSNNGKEAIALYKSDPTIDLILMDIQMPVLDGIEATKVIRNIETEEKKDTTIPIIALTAHAMKGDREKYIAAGCDGYISKPINLSNLKNSLLEYLEII
ncbi:MAG: ATP-binding protein [bacterium]